MDHRKLMLLIEQRITDQSILNLIRGFLKAPVVDKDDNGGRPRKPKSGTPQGGVLSPLLANIYLDVLERKFFGYKGPAQRFGAWMVRYADDFLIFTETYQPRIKHWLSELLEERMGLQINRSKSYEVELYDPQTSIDFVGFQLKFVRGKLGKKRYLRAEPSPKSQKRICERIGEITHSRHGFKPLSRQIRQLDRMLMGWAQYFAFGHPENSFKGVATYADSKLARWCQRKSQRKMKCTHKSWYQMFRSLGLGRIDVGINQRKRKIHPAIHLGG